MKQFLVTILFLFLTPVLIYSQNNFGFQVKTFSVAFQQPVNYELYQTKLDQNGHAFFEPGFEVFYEHFVSKGILSVKLTEGVYADPGGQIAGYTSFNLNLRFAKKQSLAKKKSQALHIGAGPIFYYRSSWAYFYEDYIPEPAVKDKENIQTITFLRVSAEYLKTINKKSDIFFSVQFGYPNAINFGVGYRYWFERRYNDCGC